MTPDDTASNFHVVVLGGQDTEALRRLVADLSSEMGLAVIAPSLEVEGVADFAFPTTAVTDRATISPGRVFVVPSDRSVLVHGRELVVDGTDQRAPLDGLLRSVADEFGPRAIGVVLAGRGIDGAIGLKRVKEAGGFTIAEQAEGELAERPDAAIASGLVDLVLPLDRIAPQISVIASSDVQLEREDAERTRPLTADVISDILTLVRVRTGHDFAPYKPATLNRRIARRMQVCECGSISAYFRYLRDHPSELGNLLRDFLISVTNFFRDPEAFAALAQDVIPKIFANRGPDENVRVWVAGCATGEEAYSIGMVLLEHADHLAAPPAIQIFATDIDEAALAEARLGSYPESIAVDVSAHRLARFFTREGGKFRVSKQLRELVLFSPHNVLRDPPFSRLDLVSCRNLMIYLDRDAQTRVLAMFHFGLRSTGYLFLGSSESAENSRIFGPLDAKARIFVRRQAPTAMSEAIMTSSRWHPKVLPPPIVPADRPTPWGELHYRILEHYAPPSAIINTDLDIVHLSEHAGRFLQLTGGEPTHQLLRLVHPGLRLDLRTAIYTARQHGHDIREVRFDDDGTVRVVELRVRTVESPELGEGALLVLFDEKRTDDTVTATVSPAGAMIEPVVREIEEELHRTRDQLRTTIEQYETSLEELKASNEELQAINEELRSATEELETSKEELQSVNEELTTLNSELKTKVEEVSHANSDLQNLMSSTEIGVVFLDRKLNIKRFTPRAQALFNLIPSDLGRPLAHLTHRLEIDDIAEVAKLVLSTLRTVEREVRSEDGRVYLTRWLPYRSIEDRIEGVVLTFVDISDLREAVEAHQRSEAALAEVETRLKMALRGAPIAIVAFDANLDTTWWYGSHGEQMLDLGAQHDRLRDVASHVLARRAGERVELDVTIDQEVRTYDFRVEPISGGVAAVGFDITPSKQAELALREADHRKDEFLATLSHELRNPLAPLRIALDVAKVADADAEQRTRSLEIMDRQVEMLTHLVDELLDLSRITQGKVELERSSVDLSRVIHSAIEMTRPALDRAKHELFVHLPEPMLRVDGDHQRLVQVFTNLLANAVNNTAERGRIDISVARERDVAVVRIMDNGDGIPATALSWIFDIFVQSRDARGRARGQGGLGIGLNVVRRLVELHGGRVYAKSEGAGRGSTFTVELPIRKG